VEAERRQVTVLFADMVGFTAFSERSGEEAAFTLMQSLAKLMEDIGEVRTATALAASIAAVVAWTTPAVAQNTPGTHQDNSGLNGSLSREDLEKLGGDKTGAT